MFIAEWTGLVCKSLRLTLDLKEAKALLDELAS
jgi:hypothetical protein